MAGGIELGGYPIAFFAGVVSFFAPCVVPLIPAYLAILAGVSYQELVDDVSAFRRKIFLSSIAYVIGFSLVFVVLGLSASALGGLLRDQQVLVERIGGLLIIFFGLIFAGFIRVPLLSRDLSFSLPERWRRLGYATPFLVGVVFGFAWTPCVGAVLASILVLASASGSAVQGGALLFVYSLGIAVPFLIVSLSVTSSVRLLKKVAPHLGLISKLGGGLLILLGVLLVTGLYGLLNSYLALLTVRLGIGL